MLFIGAKEIKLTVPPHIKAKCSETGAPMVGSKKRKARKHSITHLQPVKTDTSTGKVNKDGSELSKLIQVWVKVDKAHPELS